MGPTFVVSVGESVVFEGLHLGVHFGVGVLVLFDVLLDSGQGLGLLLSLGGLE